jgi:hypothetical protein
MVGASLDWRCPMTGRYEAACLWCRWWGQKTYGEGENMGVCHRATPSNLYNALGSNWPITVEDDFCGQFLSVETKDKDLFVMPSLNTRRPQL